MTTTTSDAKFAILKPAQIIASHTNPRKAFDAAKLQELANSIAAQGIHTPVIVRLLPNSRLADTVGFKPRPEYELIAGERRLRAALQAQAQGHSIKVPAVVRDLTDAQVLDIQLTENMQRDDLTHLEESDGIQLMIDKLGLSIDQVAAKLGLSRRSIFKRLSLQSLASEVRAARAAGQIDDARAFEISRIPTVAGQLKALELATDDHDGDLLYSVRELREYINRQIMLRIETARFDTNSKNLPKKGSNTPCSDCPKTSRNNADLFDDADAPNLCLDATCWHAKMEAHQEQQMENFEKKGFQVLTGEAAKQAAPSSYRVTHPGYIRASAEFYSEKSKGQTTYAKALGKRIKECDPKAVIHDQLQEPIEIIHQAKADAILVELGYISKEEAQENEEDRKPHAPSDPAANREKHKRIARAQELLKAELQMQITTLPALSLEGQPAAHVVILSGHNIILDELIERMNIGYTTDDEDTAVIGLNPDLDIDDQIAQMASWQKARLIVRDLAVETCSHAEPDEALLSAIGLDVPAARAAAKAAFDAEFDATQTPQPEPAPAAKPAAKGKAKGKAKASAEEASQAIAQALQQAEQEQACYQASKLNQPSLQIGQRVKISQEAIFEGHQTALERYKGREGILSKQINPVCWEVTFKGPGGGKRDFLDHDLVIVQ